MQSYVSIIIVNYNGEAYLEACLESVLKQNYPSFEVIVVDNNSNDSSVHLLKGYDTLVKIVFMQENAGFGGGCLAGLKLASGEYVALLNNDTKVAEDWLEKLVEPLESMSEIGSCASKMVVEETETIDAAGDSCTTTGRGIKIGEGEHIREYSYSGYVFGACAGAAIYRREMINDIGFLDEDFFLVREDTDFSFRAQLAGWKCYFVHNALVEHKVSASLGKLNEQAVYYAIRNTGFVRLKNMPAALLLKYLHHVIAEELATLFYFGLKHRKLRIYFRAKFDGIRLFPLFLKKRKIVYSKKRVSTAYIDSLLVSIFEEDFFKTKIRKLFRSAQ